MTKKKGLFCRKTLTVTPLPETETGWQLDDFLVVETNRGQECGRVVYAAAGSRPEKSITIKKVVRRAAAEDLARYFQLDEKEVRALAVGTEKIRQHRLALRLVYAEWLFDDSKLLIHYRLEENKKLRKTSFRDIAHDLGTALGVNVEFHQVGGRGEAKVLGAAGPCGKTICCASWLAKPKSATVKMIKEQNLPVNIMRFSGMCGKLMCCLSYEWDSYQQGRDLTKMVEYDPEDVKEEKRPHRPR